MTEFDGASRQLAKDLRETMQAAPGIRITVPHIRVFLRVVVLDLGATDGTRRDVVDYAFG